MPEQHQIWLDQVLCHSTVPVVEQDGLASYYLSGEQAIWTSKEGGGPAAIKLSPTNSEFLCLTGTFSPSLKGRLIHCSSTWEGISSDLDMPTTPHEFELQMNDGTFKTKVPVRGNKVPWGFKGRVTWEFRDEGNLVGKYDTVFELYALSQWCHEFLARDGIQLDLLRFFVLTTRPNGRYVEDYASHVVTQVHWHSEFIYNVFDGSTRYTNEHTPRQFALAKWLKDLTRNKRVVHKSTMNCIDLAQIVGIAISLGFQSADEVKALEWCSLMPFGFINPVHLIGWGAEDTNSPFIDKHGKLNLVVGQNDPLRENFKSHWFIRWHGYILDATCGPSLGTLDIEHYILKAIDTHCDRKTKLDRKGNEVIITGDINGFSNLPFTGGMHGPIAEQQVITSFDITWMSLNKPFYNKIAASQPQDEIKFIVDNLIQTLDDRCGPSFTLEPEEPFDFTMDIMLPQLGKTLSWPIRCEHEGITGALDLRITIFETVEDANLKSISCLTKTSRDPRHEIGKVRGQALVHVAEGPDSVHFFWSFGHLFVSLFAHGFTEIVVAPIAEVLQVYLEEVGAKVHPAPPSPRSGRATQPDGSVLPDSIEMNKTVEVCIEVHLPSVP